MINCSISNSVLAQDLDSTANTVIAARGLGSGKTTGAVFSVIAEASVSHHLTAGPLRKLV